MAKESASPKVLSVAPFIGTTDGHPLTYTQFLLPQPWSLYLEQKHHFYTVLEQTSPLSHPRGSMGGGSHFTLSLLEGF